MILPWEISLQCLSSSSYCGHVPVLGLAFSSSGSLALLFSESANWVMIPADSVTLSWIVALLPIADFKRPFDGLA